MSQNEGAGLGERMARFASGVKPEDLPASVWDLVGGAFADGVSVMMAGRNEEVVQCLLRAVSQPQHGESRVLFSDRRASPGDAAFINATASHALDYDDVTLSWHPSTVLVPAILAEAEANQANGDWMATAYVAGFEVWAEMAMREPESIHVKGWHPTAMYGAVGAAVAACVIGRLDARVTLHAMSLAAAMASGVVASFGSMAKPVQVGRSVQSGLLAAQLAAAGVSGTNNAMEHAQGLMAALSPSGKVDLSSPSRLGERWWLLELGLSNKQYPVCYAMHRSVDAARALLRDRTVQPGQIAWIEVLLGERQAAAIRNHLPQSALAARFSAEFAMAATVISGSPTLDLITDAYVQRPDVQALMRRVRLRTTSDLAQGDSLFSPYEQVTLGLVDGSEMQSDRVQVAHGSAGDPLGRRERLEKFVACTRGKWSSSEAAGIFDRLSGLRSFEICQLADM